MWLAACCLVAALTASASAQYEHFGPGHDLQFFSPVDFDFDDQPEPRNGWFFAYDKLSWAATSERTTIGDPNVQVFSEIIYRIDDFSVNNGLDMGDPVPQYAIINGLKDVQPPNAFGWGERYEIGQVSDGNSWSFGILDGPEINYHQTFGSGPQTSGFGSVHINFVTPPDYLRGFRNYFSNGDNTPGLVINGPGGAGGAAADDLNGDLNEAVNVLLDANDDPIAIITDFNDSTHFNVRFNQLTLRNTTETQGVEFMHTFQLNNRHKMKSNQNNHANVGLGVRYLRLTDTFAFGGTSDLFRGTNLVTTISENHVVGPQIRGSWTSQRGRWNTSLDGRFVWGYNAQALDQQGTWGENLLTGGENQPEVAQPTTFHNGRNEDEFTPIVEVRANMTYQVTGAIAARLGYTAMFIDNISRASQIVEYRLPDWGISRNQTDIFINGVNFGFDVVY